MILRAEGWDFDQYQDRYSSAEDARAGHQAALRLVTTALAQEHPEGKR